MAASDSKWPQEWSLEQVTASDRKWPQVTASDRKWPQVTASSKIKIQPQYALSDSYCIYFFNEHLES